MSTTHTSRGLRASLATALLAGGLALGLSHATTVPADAAARVTVTNDRGTSLADTRYQTKLTVKGSGFQSVTGGFGGVYLMFGTVNSGWQPSKGGVTGQDYRYVPDSESSANQGYMKFIAFPGSSTAGEAQAVLSSSGAFSLALTVPGPVFQSVDRNGKVSTVDCRTATCGIITIGAHGVKNARNETFTPIDFGTVHDSAPAGSGAGSGREDDEAAAPADSSAAPSTSSAPSEAASKPARNTAPTVTADRRTAQAGRTLAFSGTGFTPGEQVLAILDDGVAAHGPMIAGINGDVAGVLVLPAELPAGTHELRLSGATSRSEPTQRFPVRAAITTEATKPSAADSGSDRLTGAQLFLLVAGLAFLFAAAGLAFTLLRRRRTPAAAASGAAA